MKGVFLIFLAAIVSQKGLSQFGDLAVVNGQVYNYKTSQLWKYMDGKILVVRSNLLLVQTYQTKVIQQAVVTRRLKENAFMTTDESKKYHDVTEMVNVGTEEVNGKKVVLVNYQPSDKPAVGNKFPFYAMQIGTTNFGEECLELWDLGTPPTADDIKKLRDDYLAKQLKMNQSIAAQNKVIADKAAASKKQNDLIVLKSNQDAADKGDAYGLLRMGERYRDGDGVEKDLSKAREYFHKAADAGSTTATEALKNLPSP